MSLAIKLRLVNVKSLTLLSNIQNASCISSLKQLVLDYMCNNSYYTLEPNDPILNHFWLSVIISTDALSISLLCKFGGLCEHLPRLSLWFLPVIHILHKFSVTAFVPLLLWYPPGSMAYRVAKIWNSLSPNAVWAPTLGLFKHYLFGEDLSEFVVMKYNYDC